MGQVSTDVDAAMGAQLRHFRHELTRGMPRLGWKIGYNDARLLERYGLERPMVGWLAGDRALKSGDRYALRRGTRVAVEAEVAVRVGSGSAAEVAPALELVNFSLPVTSFAEALEHDIFHDAVVLGRPALPVPIADGTWPHVTRNGVEVARRDPSLMIVQPARAIRIVADTLARYQEHLESDDWIICGSLVAPITVHVGDVFEADFGPLGRVSVEIGG
jgi:2-oxo-hept-3-ene-1,7-dioate hydratase